MALRGAQAVQVSEPCLSAERYSRVGQERGNVLCAEAYTPRAVFSDNGRRWTVVVCAYCSVYYKQLRKSVTLCVCVSV